MEKKELRFPLTQSQLRLWTGQRMYPNIPLNNAVYSFDIAGAVDVEIFQKTFQQVLDHTDALRIVFGESNGEAFQSVLRPFPFKMEIVDFTLGEGNLGKRDMEVNREIEIDKEAHKNVANDDIEDDEKENNYENGKEDFISDWINRRMARPLSPETRIFDTALLKLSNTRYLWFLNMDHLVTDAISFKIIFNRMDAIYRSILTNGPDTSPTSPAFQDYVRFEKQQATHSDALPAKTYWKDKMADRPDMPKLYGRALEPQSTPARRISLTLDAGRTALLRRLVKDPDVWTLNRHLTEFTVFATLYFIFLHRVSGQQRLAIGAPVHNRTTPEFRETVGLFLEVLPLFCEVNEGDTFDTVLEKVQEETLSYLRHIRPGMASPEIGQSFNAVFNYISADFSDFNGYPVHTKWIHNGHMDGSHAIRCHVYDFKSNGEPEIAFDLDESVFSAKMADRVPGHFLRLFDALLSDRDESIVRPSLISDGEKEMLLGGSESEEDNDFASRPNGINGISALVSSSILEVFERQASRRPNAVAVRCGSEILTYGALNKKADLMALYLAKKGIGSKRKIALHMHRSTEYLIGILAVLKSGATFIPIASDQPAERVEYILSDSDCSLVLTEEIVSEKLGAGINSNPEVEPDATAKPNQKAQPDAELASIAGAGLGSNLATRSIENIKPKPESPAYILYTSGSTGRPKGVAISHAALYNYMSWAENYYDIDETTVFPLFTSIGFDLTLTSNLLPLLSGGQVIVYPEKKEGPDLALMQVLDDNLVNAIKLTPSHLALLQERDVSTSALKMMIVGGEDLKSSLARSIHSAFPEGLTIYNEYGPTEATIGCIVGKFHPTEHTFASVPIGKPIDRMQAMVLDAHQNLVPEGVIGELYLSGEGLANGYIGDVKWKNDEKVGGKERLTKEEKWVAGEKSAVKTALTTDKFLDHPFKPDSKMYRTGDMARINSEGEFEYLGRIDDQIKLRGHRIELTEIEANLSALNGIENCAVVVVDQKESVPENEVGNCTRCGLPSNYPNTDFNDQGVCHLCTAFDTYKNKVDSYFKNDEDLVRILTSKREEKSSRFSGYDCISLLSGGKDSTYVLARLVNMGLKVLAFTMDNGYISDQAKANVDRIVGQLGVDHVYGKTPHMNEIFVDSLHRHHNVCNGCFKTIYTLSTQIALEKNIPFIVTGLSRGQFFETRLTEELFWDDTASSGSDKIDQTILEARKLYHREPDAVKDLLDVSAFESDTVFEKVQFVDFYRYSDVSLEEMLVYLKDKIGWVRPTDTGRSTNCLINQVGIYVHKKEEGYSNYAFPYSWDVRLGHKMRQESLEEINEAIDEVEVKRIMNEIGYDRAQKEAPQGEKLVAYFTGDASVSVKDLRESLSKKLPSYMVPTVFKHLYGMPLTTNGKVDKKALKNLSGVQLAMDTPYLAPRNDIEQLLENIWKEVMQLQKIGVHDDFLALGGHSLAAIRVTARINDEIGTDFPLNKVFERPTIAEYANFIEEALTELLKE